MPLIPKPNYNQIFASQAPDIDKPAVFNNYPEGWGPESRPNNGKPTIKGFNYLQQTSDLKVLWILQNGACLPYDESIEYAEGAPVLKDGVIQYKVGSGFKSRDSVTIPTYSSAATGVDPVTGVADGAYFNVRSSSDESYIDEYQNVGGSAVATGKSYLSALGVQLQEKSASTIKDASGRDQQEINDYTALKFKETPSPIDFPSIKDGLENVVGGVVSLKLLENTYTLTETVTLGLGHNICGNGDYSVIKAPIGGTALKYKYTVGTLPYTHFGRVIEKLRISGDGASPTNTVQGGGTTTGYHQDASGHHGFTQQVTFDRHNIGMRINNAYVNSALNNFYRGNEVGLLLESVTSHTEYSPYIRGNKTAGIKITGYMQNVQIFGGAAENNLGRAIWCTDLTTTDSLKRLRLVELYTEGNGDLDTGVPAIEIDDHEGMHVSVEGGVYARTSRSGIFTGVYKWGNSVSIDSAVMANPHYAKVMDIKNVHYQARLNTYEDLALAKLNGLTEPTVLLGISATRVASVIGSVFQIATQKSRIKSVSGINNKLSKVYPYGASVSGLPSLVENATLDFGQGSWIDVDFNADGSNSSNYCNLFTDLNVDEDAVKVYTALIRPDNDIELSFISAGSTSTGIVQAHNSHFKFLKDKTYHLCFMSFNTNTVGESGAFRLRAYKSGGSSAKVSIFPTFMCSSPNQMDALDISNQICTSTGVVFDASKVVAYNPPSIPVGSTHTTIVPKKEVKVGDVVQATFSIYNADIELSAVVSAVDEVTVSFKNTGDSPVDLSSGNIFVVAN